MTPVPHSDLPALFFRAGRALLGLALSTLSPQHSLLLWDLLGRGGGKRSRPHPEHIPPTPLPAALLSREFHREQDTLLQQRVTEQVTIQMQLPG